MWYSSSIAIVIISNITAILRASNRAFFVCIALIILAAARKRVCNFVACRSPEECKRGVISFRSQIFLSVWYPQLPSNKPQTNPKDAIEHDVIVHFGFPGNTSSHLGSFYSSSVYWTLANRKVFLRQITAGCKHNSARLNKWLEILAADGFTPKERWPELQRDQRRRRRSVNRAAYIKPESE